MNNSLNKNTLTPNSLSIFAYNGMKLDNEVSGNGNSYTTLFRELDVRLGRWWAVDPKSELLPWQSSYNSMDNNPIWHNDPLGDEVKNPYESHKNNKSKIDEKKDKAANSMSKKEIKKLNSEIDKLQQGLDNYNKVESLTSDFKAKVGDDEFNKLDNYTFNGKEIDIYINLDERPVILNKQGFYELAPFDGSTDFQYSLIEADVTNYKTKEKTKEKRVGDLHKIDVHLYVQNLTTLSNEFGDIIFFQIRPNTFNSEIKLDYLEQTTSLFSFEYEDWVMGKKQNRPNPETFQK
jgi:hypothetical protein